MNMRRVSSGLRSKMPAGRWRCDAYHSRHRAEFRQSLTLARTQARCSRQI